MPNPYKVANTLSAIDAAYIAGLVDGEGTVTLVRRHANENKQIAVTISSTEKQLLDFVRERVGVGRITTKRTYAAHHRQSFAYGVHNRQALQFLRQIEPYLISYKIKRCRLALAEYLNVTPRNGKYTPELRERRRCFEETFLAIKPE